MILDFEAIGRILQAMQLHGLEVPDDLLLPESGTAAGDALLRLRRRRLELAYSIGWAFTWRQTLPDLARSSRSKARYRALKRVADEALALAMLIEDAGMPLSSSLSQYFPNPLDSRGAPDGCPNFDQLLIALRHLNSAARAERQRLRETGLDASAPLDASPGTNRSQATPGDEFILSLGESYQEFFGAEPLSGAASGKRYDKAGAPVDPFIAFVASVTGEYGIPMKPEAIRKAWERAKSSDKTP